MKLSFGIFCFLVVALCATNASIIYPEELLNDAVNVQYEINSKQNEIFGTISNLREKFSKILKTTAESTLKDIEGDVRAVFNIDEPLRDVLYNKAATPCITSLKTLLNQESEFTGFQSGVCLTKYDNDVSKVITEAHNVVGVYDNELNQIELSVVHSFTSHNAWTQPDQIRDRFNESYNKYKDALQSINDNIGNIDINIQEQIDELRQTLNGCYKVSQDSLSSAIQRLESKIKTCDAFDG